MPDVYQVIVNTVQERIEKYQQVLSNININVQPLFDFNINYKNERSIASFITYELFEIFNDLGMTDVSVLNEMDLRLNSTITDQQISEIESCVDQALINAKKKKFIPDTFVTFLDTDNNRISIFVEYKVNSSFKYLQLANDYIKFKHYSINSTTKPYFVYVLLNPNDNGLLITLKNNTLTNPKYQLIDVTINEQAIDSTANIFIYKNEDTNSNLSDDLLNIVDEINKKMEDFNLLALDNSFDEIFNYGENAYYTNMGKFASRVLTSQRIRKKYSEILRLFNTIKQYEGVIEVPEDSFITLEDFKSDSINTDFFIEKLTRYFNNQIRNQTSEDENDINNAEFSYSRKRALWIQMLLQKFSEDFSETYELVHYYDPKEREDSIGIFERLQSAYNGHYKKNFNQLALGLIYYIVQLYKALFSLNENKLEYKKEFLAYEIKSSILKQIKKYRKTIGLSRILIDWDSNILDQGKEILVQVLSDLKM